jgi:hypothetical protein
MIHRKVYINTKGDKIDELTLKVVEFCYKDTHKSNITKEQYYKSTTDHMVKTEHSLHNVYSFITNIGSSFHTRKQVITDNIYLRGIRLRGITLTSIIF